MRGCVSQNRDTARTSHTRLNLVLTSAYERKRRTRNGLAAQAAAGPSIGASSTRVAAGIGASSCVKTQVDRVQVEIAS